MTKHKGLKSAVLAIAAFALIAGACGGSSDTATEETTAPVTEETTAPVVDPCEGSELKLGIAFDTGGRGDGTFNDSAARGGEQAAAELCYVVSELEATTDDDRKPNLEALVAAGNNPVIAVGFAFGGALEEVAAANPNVTFGWVDGYLDLPNVKTLGFSEQEGSFLVGAAAALKSTTGTIGFIGGQEIDLIKRFEAGYIAGAKAVNPAIKVESKYLGAAGDNAAWGSPDKAKEIASSWFKKGADIVYTAAGGSGAGTIDAAVEAGEGKWAIGVDSDQYLTATPEQQAHILTSMLKRVDVSVFLAAKAVKEGDVTGG
ncbi:MAG: BMP family ABC transporter substrate-binding protein, partial [Actinobacteria bacterium]|nr:BMP family ABC transporter substrate-binding protein [Actinomycetota bacterium]